MCGVLFLVRKDQKRPTKSKVIIFTSRRRLKLCLYLTSAFASPSTFASHQRLRQHQSLRQVLYCVGGDTNARTHTHTHTHTHTQNAFKSILCVNVCVTINRVLKLMQTLTLMPTQRCVLTDHNSRDFLTTNLCAFCIYTNRLAHKSQFYT